MGGIMTQSGVFLLPLTRTLVVVVLNAVSVFKRKRLELQGLISSAAAVRLVEQKDSWFWTPVVVNGNGKNWDLKMAERVNNFPPLPQFMRIKPCFYQNIVEEIPGPHQQLVRRAYILWMMYSGTLCLNVISCIAWWAGGGSATNFGFSLLWLFLFSPCGYVCWFRPLYKALRADSSFNFMAFFFIFFLQCVLAVIQTIGISGWGTCGWIATVMFFSVNVGSAVVMLITTLFFTLVTLLMAVVLIKVHSLYRGGGGSLGRAQEEWSSGLWKSAPVREAGFNAVAQQSAQGPSLPQYPTAVPSYPSNSQW